MKRIILIPFVLIGIAITSVLSFYAKDEEENEDKMCAKGENDEIIWF